MQPSPRAETSRLFFPSLRFSIVISLAPFLKHTLHNRYCRKNIRPTRIERQLREDLGGLRFREAVIHRPVEVIRNLCNLAEAMSAQTVTKLRSRGASAGRSQRSRKSNSP